MREFEPFACAGEDHHVIADDVAAAKRCKADRAWLAFAGDALARIDGISVERHTRARSRGLAEAKRSAGRRIHLVPMMHLEDLDVERRAEAPRRLFNELGENRDTDAHVRRPHDWNRCRALGNLPLSIGVETRGAHDGGNARLRARREVDQRSGGPREIDEDIATGRHGVHVRADANARCPTEMRARIGADRRTSRDVERTGECEVVGTQRRLDQCLPHAATCAGNGNAHGHRLIVRRDSITAETRRENDPTRSFRWAAESATPWRSRSG